MTNIETITQQAIEIVKGGNDITFSFNHETDELYVKPARIKVPEHLLERGVEEYVNQTIALNDTAYNYYEARGIDLDEYFGI